MTLSACASAPSIVGKIPTEQQDFTLSKNELSAKFPVITNYDLEHIKISDAFIRCTSIEDLTNSWGKPTEITNDWLHFHAIALGAVAVGSIAGGGIAGATIGTGIVMAMMPLPYQTYTWNKGNYSIEAKVDTGIFCGYRTRIQHWNWKEKKVESRFNKEDAPAQKPDR
jgi:hypothetical protein